MVTVMDLKGQTGVTRVNIMIKNVIFVVFVSIPSHKSGESTWVNLS
jgi:hypothetical protein